jgi:DNA-binding response OmpR family regulator
VAAGDSGDNGQRREPVTDRAAGEGSILLAEDDQRLAELVRGVLLAGGYEVVVMHDGLEALRAEEPMAAILDVNLPGVSGYQVCDALRRAYGPTLPIVFISGERTEPFDRVAGLLVGADDYLVKPFEPGELLARITGLVERRASPADSKRGLTGREHEVLGLLADGLRQEEIADRLVISKKTVGTHIEHILGKLGVRSRAEAVAVAYRDSLVP